MDLNNVYCGDIETDGLLDTISKIHVFSLANKSGANWNISSTNSYDEIRTFFKNAENVIAIHNGIRFDRVAIEKVLGFGVKATIIDTLAVAWYIDNGRAWDKYGLEWYGESFKTEKPVVDDWTNLTYQEYRHRCEVDVEITIKLWEKLIAKLRRVYECDDDIVRIIKYLNFIMECSLKQEQQKIEIDVNKVMSNLSYFESLKAAKVDQLKLVMPKIPIKKIIKPRAKGHAATGNLWDTVTELPEKYDGHEIIVGYQEPNPNSTPQKKAWLYSLGWKPKTFAHKRDEKTGKVRKIEQILTKDKELCPSVLSLIDVEPSIEILDGISVLTHRIGLLKGLLKNHTNGFMVQGLTQLAVTLRWQHSVIVNMPKVTGKGDIRDGRWIRECFVAGSGLKIVQSDLVGIESKTSDHFTHPLNPDLIEEAKAKYFDHHTKIGVVSRLMTPDEEVWFKWKKENKERVERGEPELPVEAFGSLSPSFRVGDEKALMTKLKRIRDKAKTTNYSCLYLVGARSLSNTLDVSQREAQTLIDTYWEINWAVKEVTKTFDIKKVGDEMWILNPINKFRYHLRNKKDAFSTVNQSSAVYCFNMWLYNITRSGIWPILQTHDDLAIRCHDNETEKVKKVILSAMDKLNRQLKLNVRLSCDVQVGNNLAETH